MVKMPDRPACPIDRLSDALIGKSVDPLSGILQLLAHFTMRDDCNVTSAVFDGKRRFDLIVKDLGKVSIHATTENAYIGPAHKCALSFNMIAGKPKDIESRKFWQPGRGEDNRPPFTIWMARLRPDLPPTPVMAETTSPFGLIVVHLASWHIDAPPQTEALFSREEPKPH